MAEEVEQTKVTKDAKGLSVAGMVLGISSVVLAVWLGFILGTLAIIFSAIGLKRKKNGLAIAGLATGIVGVAISLIVGVFITIAAYVGIQERANESSILASASTVQKHAELFAADNGAYPSFDEMKLEAAAYGVTVSEQGTGEGGDIVYIPCYGDGGIIWYWSDEADDYISLYVGTTDTCEWN